MRMKSVATLATVVMALLIVAKSRTVILNEATGSGNAVSIHDLHVGHAHMKNLPVQEIPLP